MSKPISTVEISQSAVKKNLEFMRGLISDDCKLLMCVKANAYGHGLVPMSKVLEKYSLVDFLGVNALFEAEELLENNIKLPILILGYIPLSDLETAVQKGFHISVSNAETLEAIADISSKLKKTARVHLKLETGLNRLGIIEKTLPFFLSIIGKSEHIELTGIYSHFANVENVTDQQYANFQLTTFKNIVEKSGANPKLLHMSASAAIMLFPEAHLDMTRVGIAGYGLWPSAETKTSFLLTNKTKDELHPVLSWKTRIAQIKTVAKGTPIGYGCTYTTDQETTLAVLPIGYYDGYDRGLSNLGHVLVNGEKAPIRGTICMNMCMVDITHIQGVSLEDEVVLIGSQGKYEITVDYLASLLKTINYEVVTRINEKIERKVV